MKAIYKNFVLCGLGLFTAHDDESSPCDGLAVLRSVCSFSKEDRFRKEKKMLLEVQVGSVSSTVVSFVPRACLLLQRLGSLTLHISSFSACRAGMIRRHHDCRRGCYSCLISSLLPYDFSLYSFLLFWRKNCGIRKRTKGVRPVRVSLYERACAAVPE